MNPIEEEKDDLLALVKALMAEATAAGIGVHRHRPPARRPSVGSSPQKGWQVVLQITEIQLALLELCVNGGGAFSLVVPTDQDDAQTMSDLLATNVQSDDLVDEDLLTNIGDCVINGRAARAFTITALGRSMFSHGQSAGTSKLVN